MSAVVPHNHDFAREQCIDAAFKPIDAATDWDAVRADVASLNLEGLTAELLAGQPYENNDVNALKVFRLHTRIRMAHRYRRGLPQEAAHTCAVCGSRKSDPVLGQDWKVGVCLHCAEEAFLVPEEHARYGEPALMVAYDTSNSTWGIAFATEEERQKSAGIIVTGYPNREEAVLACAAPDRFVSIFNQVCAAGHEVNSSEVLPYGELFSENLPMNPEQWRVFVSAKMRAATTELSEPYGSEIKEAIGDYFSAKRPKP